ncbi:MAG: hypothetical protein JSS66_02070 [Armatimonadetes bacterium]|nr:hypothetical protein [Armatimonadota bacterium]
MNYQQQMIDSTQKAADEAFKYAKAVPGDKVSWSPLDSGRSVLDQCREMAMCPGWAFDIIEGKEQPEWNEETMAAIKAEQEQWKSVEDCQAECNRRLGKLFELYRGISDDRLKETKWLPYDGGRDFTVAEMMDYPRWNFNYHLGQIAYVQTLYGDKDMH